MHSTSGRRPFSHRRKSKCPPVVRPSIGLPLTGGPSTVVLLRSRLSLLPRAFSAAYVTLDGQPLQRRRRIAAQPASLIPPLDRIVSRPLRERAFDFASERLIKTASWGRFSLVEHVVVDSSIVDKRLLQLSPARLLPPSSRSSSMSSSSQYVDITEMPPLGTR